MTDREREQLDELLANTKLADKLIARLMDKLGEDPRPPSPTGESEWSLRAAGRKPGYRTRGRLS